MIENRAWKQEGDLWKCSHCSHGSAQLLGGYGAVPILESFLATLVAQHSVARNFGLASLKSKSHSQMLTLSKRLKISFASSTMVVLAESA